MLLLVLLEVIACAVGSKGSKRIAKILDISPRTVETHIQNISSKLSCNGQYGINDFIEQSEYLHPIKNHYLGLLMQYRLRTELKRVGSEIERAKVSCYINSNIKDDNLENISKYLKIAKVEILDNHDNSNIQELRVLTEEDIELLEQGKQFTNTIFICARDELKDSIDNFPKVKILDCIMVDHLCFSVFKILNLLAPAINLRSYEQEFTAAYKNLFPSNGEIKEPVEIENIKEEEGPIVKRRIIKILIIVLGIIIVILSRSLMKQQISNAVEPVSYFVNHVKQIKLLEQNLAKYKKTSVVGVSGIGKTQITRMHVRENSKNYDIIWFFDCNLNINVEFLDLAKAINKAYGPGTIAENAETSKMDVMKYLGHKDRWLLVFDNLKVKENNKIRDLIEWAHNGHVIFASQTSEFLPHVIEVVSFAKQDSEELARNILIEDNPEAVEFLATEFKGYPILIVQGAQLLNHVKGLSFEEYKREIQESSDKIRLNITLAKDQLNQNSVDLLNKIALINNQAFSKDLLKIISNNSEKIGDDICQLSKFALISNIDTDKINPVFEMHDVSKSAILDTLPVELKQQYLNDLLDSFNELTPRKQGSLNRYHKISNDKSMIGNHEILADNAEKYQADLYKLMELKKTLLDFYGINDDLNNCKKLTTWFKKHEEEKVFNFRLMNNDQKASYCWYMALMGMYEDSAYLETAENLLDKIEDYPRVKTGVYDIIAFTEISRGNIDKAKKIIPIIQEINDKNIGNVNANRILSVQARLFLAEGKYKEALEFMNKFIEVEQKVDGHINAHYLIAKARILNHLQQFKDAYKILQDLDITKDTSDHIIALVAQQKSVAELGMYHIKKSNTHIDEAIEIFTAGKVDNLNDSSDPDLAYSYVVKADLLFAENNLMESLKYYQQALVIYQNLYQDRIKNIAQISDLYLKASKASCKAKDRDLFKKYSQLQIEQFGKEHQNTIAMLEYYKTCDMDF